jgi:hypothetical protein
MIFTLDGKAWREEELLDKMKSDEFYYGYMGQNSLSSSSIKLLAKKPLKYLNSIGGESEYNSAFDFGSLFHWYVLEPDVYAKQHFVDVPKRMGKVWKSANEEYGRVFLQSDKEKVEAIADSFLSCSKIDHILQHSRPEVPAVGNIGGYCFRAKADILGDGYIADLKTCQNIRWFKNDAWKFGYSAQVYIYCELFGIDYTNWVFIAVDKLSGDFGFYTISEEFYLNGKGIVEQGIENYKRIEAGDIDFEPTYIEDVI